MDLYSSVYTKESVWCNAIRGIGYKYSLRPLFWQEVKEFFFQMVLVNLLVMQVCI